MKKKIRICLITDWFAPNYSACSVIVYQLAELLKKNYDAEICIVGYSNLVDHKYEEVDYASTEPIPVVTQTIENINATYSSIISRVFHQLTSSESVEVYLKYFFDNRKYYFTFYDYVDKIKQLSKEGIDCFVGFCRPEMTLEALAYVNMSTPFIAFMLDPWSTFYRVAGDKKIKKIEKETFKKAKKIFVTNLIKRDYEDNKENDILKKCVTVDFPNIVPYKCANPTKKFLDCRIHCVFSGSLYKDIRNPNYTLKLFENIKNKNIIFDLIGIQDHDNSLPKNLPLNVVCHGRVISNEAMQYMQSADILVNIGNTVLNQMPSKILTYISLGKPILNIIKSPECPTLPYMEKYPLALNVLETPEVQQEDVDRVLEFIQNNVGKHVPFETVEKLYETCTPKYVGNQLYQAICEVVEQNKRQTAK